VSVHDMRTPTRISDLPFSTTNILGIEVRPTQRQLNGQHTAGLHHRSRVPDAAQGRPIPAWTWKVMDSCNRVPGNGA
jgi:hypothetical protein